MAVLVATAVLAVAPPAAQGSASRASGGHMHMLTRWERVGFWVHTRYKLRVHAQHNTRSKVVARLRSRTEEGFPEVYLVLSSYRERSGRTWLKLGLPMRPNGTTGWVVKGAVWALHEVRAWLVVDRRKLRASFYEDGRKTWSAPVGIGTPSTPTPRGLFWVREHFEPGESFYGPFAFGTSAYTHLADWPGGQVVGIHGTDAPSLIPGHPSHGCVRLRNADILWLARHMSVGTPIATIN